jgi:gluconokinase
MVVILFGPPGVGKNYVGRILAQNYQFFFYDADEDLTADMAAAIEKEQAFTPEMRQHFFNIVNEKIHALKKQHRHVAVAQALIKESNRLQLKKALPEAHFIQIIANLQRIKQRIETRNDWISWEFAEKLHALFEAPQLKHYDIYNNSNADDVKKQFEQVMALINAN